MEGTVSTATLAEDKLFFLLCMVARAVARQAAPDLIATQPKQARLKKKEEGGET